MKILFIFASQSQFEVSGVAVALKARSMASNIRFTASGGFVFASLHAARHTHRHARATRGTRHTIGTRMPTKRAKTHAANSERARQRCGEMSTVSTRV